MSFFNFPIPAPPRIPGDTSYKTSKISNLYPVETTGPYTDWKLHVVASTTIDITLSGTPTVDGVVLELGDRVLVKDQSNGAENGIYVVNSQVWLRANDLCNGTSATALCIFVNEGTVNKNTAFLCSNQGPCIVGTDILTFIPVAGSGFITKPALPLNSVQYNNANAFGGSSSFTFDPLATNNTLSLQALGVMTVGQAAADLPANRCFNITAATPTTAAPWPGGILAITGGSPNGDSSGGNLMLSGGPSGATANSGSVLINTLTGGQGSNSGTIYLTTGPPNATSGKSGNILLETGNSTTGDSGYISLTTGNVSVAGNGGTITLMSGTSASGFGGDINITAGTGTINGVINLYTNGVPVSVLNSGLKFTKDTVAPIADLTVPPSVTTSSRQGVITITDPSALLGNSSISITVNNVNVLIGDNVSVSIQGFDILGTGIPMVLVSSITAGVGFNIQLYNLSAVAFSASVIEISFQLF